MKLSENWSEYETDEKNTNAFFDTTKGTGNLRITPMNYDMKNSTEYLNRMRTEKNAEKINWKNVEGIYYVENKNNEEINIGI
ncbi:hypothetical protein DRF58_16280 [Epilithonimonas hispanica]|uniref:Uncharacterized protein n=1 Tax=Epilithonimonas hispanica TaxID=358687 RepID=A0A3D9CLL8_9FLAO|nr:hypothetical protein DRF58_16280 [Epilithonimonas hispanica]